MVLQTRPIQVSRQQRAYQPLWDVAQSAGLQCSLVVLGAVMVLQRFETNRLEVDDRQQTRTFCAFRLPR